MTTSNSIRVVAVLGAFVAGCSGTSPESAATKSQTSQLASPACVSQDDGLCGGFVAHPCTCAPGLVCKPNRIPDVPGTCEEKRCCPVGWDMYACKEENGTSGLNCHNPLLGCASSLTCGGGCDSEVTGRCEPTCVTAADCHGVLPQLCVACPEGGSACAHWACVTGKCEVAYCP